MSARRSRQCSPGSPAPSRAAVAARPPRAPSRRPVRRLPQRRPSARCSRGRLARPPISVSTARADCSASTGACRRRASPHQGLRPARPAARLGGHPWAAARRPEGARRPVGVRKAAPAALRSAATSAPLSDYWRRARSLLAPSSSAGGPPTAPQRYFLALARGFVAGSARLRGLGLGLAAAAFAAVGFSASGF